MIASTSRRLLARYSDNIDGCENERPFFFALLRQSQITAMSASARLNPIPANGWIEWFESPARMSPGLPMLLVTDGLRPQIFFF